MNKLGPLAMLAIALSASPSAFSEEYFGKFLDKLRGEFNVSAKPRPTFKLLTDFRFDDPNGLQWIAPAGIEVDGASIPQYFWSFIGGPFEGEYINASVIHDYYCHTKTRTSHDTHRNFYYGMLASGVAKWKAAFMYWAVDLYGPSWKLDSRVTFTQQCTPLADGNATCHNTPNVDTVIVASPQIDLSDPEVLALALSKATAVAKTLRTSDGKILDVTTKGPVLATLDNIETNSNAYRQIFLSKDFYSSPTRLGVMANVEASTDLAAIEPWSGNQIPKLSETRVLTSGTAQTIGSKSPFKLDARSAGLVRDQVNLEAIGSKAILITPK